MTGQSEIPPLESLESMSRRLERARWIAVCALPPLSLFMAGPLDMMVNCWGLIRIAAILLAANLLVVLHRKRMLGQAVDGAVRTVRLDVQVRLQLAVDVLCITFAFHFAGGIESFVPFLGLFHVASTSAVMGFSEGRKVVWALLTGSLIVIMLEYNEAARHWHAMNDFRWNMEKEPKYVFLYIVMLTVVLLTTAWAADPTRFAEKGDRRG